MPRFTDYTLADAQDAVADSLALDAADYDVNRKFVEDKDHWQDGNGFIGLSDAPAAVRTRALVRVQKHFTPVDIIGEVADRFTNALLKTQADVAFVPVEPGGPDGTPSDQQKTEADDMLRVISRWWDDVGLWGEARKALARSRWAGRGGIRRYIPREQLDRVAKPETPVEDQGADTQATSDALSLPTNLPFPDALKRIRLAAEQPNAAAIVTDPDSLETVAIVLFTEGGDGTPGTGRDAAELWMVERDATGAPTLKLRVLREGAKKTTGPGREADSVDTFDFAGVDRLPLAEMTADVLITPIVCQEQRRANYFESVLVRTIEGAGFRERYTNNAAPELEWLLAAPTDTPALDTKEQGGKTWYGYPKARTLGSGTQVELRGIPIKDADGKTTGITNPSVTIADPVDPSFAITGCEHARASILKDCHQAHVLGAENLQRSGVSIVQARADFADDLVKCKTPLETLIADTIAGAIATAQVMSSEFAGFLERFRVVVTVHPNPGPLTPEERAQNAADVAAGLLSDETAMARGGVEDVDAERQRIAASPMGALALSAKKATTLKAWLDAQAPLPFAAKMSGLTEAEAQELVTGITDNQGVTQ